VFYPCVVTNLHELGISGIRIAAMRIIHPVSLLIALTIFCIGCTASPEIPRAQVRSTETAVPAGRKNAAGASASVAAVEILPSTTHTPTILPAATLIPVARENMHIFPVQPQGSADFSPGGHAFPATDIYAPMGAEFVALTGGVVDFVSLVDVWVPASDDPAVAGGLCVAIIGDDGVRYYGSHLSAIASGIRPGVRVEAGRLLGLVGRSGNAGSTPPHLHFGISHPTYAEDWLTRRGELDPYPYLVAWSRGENVTPAFPEITPA
jgi:murein DD-endopeptidase MepM/ murein hydrolase activator NlpD